MATRCTAKHASSATCQHSSSFSSFHLILHSTFVQAKLHAANPTIVQKDGDVTWTHCHVFHFVVAERQLAGISSQCAAFMRKTAQLIVQIGGRRQCAVAFLWLLCTAAATRQV
jgi:hypothetical protein